LDNVRKSPRTTLPVLYQSERLVVVQKPAGLASQPGAGIKSSVVEVVEQQLGVRPYLVHRLDRDTDGLLVLARNHEAAGAFSKQMNGPEVEKSYLAICAGRFGRPTGQIDESVTVKGVERSALTRYRVLRSIGKFSLLEITLGTGRMHQIRIHLAQTGRPVVGDDLHGDFALNRELRRTHGVKNLMLCAFRLRFPDGRKSVVLTAELPEHMLEFLAVYNAVDAIPPATERVRRRR